MRLLYTYIAALLFTVGLSAQVPDSIVKPDSGQSSYIINSGSGTQNLQARLYVLFKPGVHIQSGAELNVTIDADAYVPPVVENGSNSENYIYVRNYQNGMRSDTSITKNSDVLEQITYFDGLGRPIQDIAIKASPNFKDLLTHMEYDDYGRQAKDFLPFEADGSPGSYRTPSTQELAAQNFYKTAYPDDFLNIATANTNPFAFGDFEDSPLNRVTAQAAPGEDWKNGNGHEIRYDYEANQANEVRIFNVTFTNNSNKDPILGGGNTFYAAGTLNKTVTKDENWTSGKNHSTEEFVDNLGRIILKRSYADSDINRDGDTDDAGETEASHDTYYVYDDFGNLTYVITPQVDLSGGSVSNATLDALCYQYKYDHRNRLIEKQLPGKGKEYFVYNKLDQLVMSQDANLLAENKWLFTKYDALGRVAFTGMIYDLSGRTTVQQEMDNYTGPLWVSRGSSTLYERGGTASYSIPISYNNTSYPTTTGTIEEVHAVYYYDDYTFEKDGIVVPTQTTYGDNINQTPKGRPTGSYLRWGIGEGNYMITAYDDKDRVIYTHKRNTFLDSDNVVASSLDHAGKVLETTTTQSRSEVSDIVLVDTYEYDHAARQTKHEQTLAGNTQLIAANTYDNLGLLVGKKVGNTEASPLQNIDYTYNIRGWLTQINDVDDTTPDKLFNFRLGYNIDHFIPLYNGNISKAEWRTKNTDQNLKNYFYSYDGMNRIQTGNDNTGRYNMQDISYDKNGNITSLLRMGHIVASPSSANSGDFGTMDNLSYAYDSGNKLLNVTDTGNVDYGFKDVVGSTDDYTYDNNGNMITDANKGIIEIKYNYLNLPTSVLFDNPSSSKIITYIYDSEGTKIQKAVQSGGYYTEDTEYDGLFVYENGTLEARTLLFISHPEGYIEPDGSGGYVYTFQYKDHLGNVRLSYADVDGSGSIDPNTEIREENNYYAFGLKHKGYNNVQNGRDHKWEFQEQEFTEDLGLNVTEMDFRHYDSTIGRFMVIDPMSEDFLGENPYHFVSNNPVLLSDPTGLSTNVTKNEDGTYTVVGGNADDGDNSIYLVSNEVNKDGTRDFITDADGNNISIGESLTSHSFFFDDGSAVEGAIIDLNSTEGQDFVDGIIEENPSLAEYLPNAVGGQKYDHKVAGIENKGEGVTPEQYKYRGSRASNGKIGSARDFGNGAAGIIAGRKGIPYFAARVAFDALEGMQKNDGKLFVPTPGLGGSGDMISTSTLEGKPTRLAQRLGFDVGRKIVQQEKVRASQARAKSKKIN